MPASNTSAARTEAEAALPTSAHHPLQALADPIPVAPPRRPSDHATSGTPPATEGASVPSPIKRLLTHRAPRDFCWPPAEWTRMADAAARCPFGTGGQMNHLGGPRITDVRQFTAG